MAKHVEKQYFDDQGNFIIKPYRLKDLASIFDVNVQTLKRWMKKYPKELNERDGKYFTANQVRFCIEKFGLPQKVSIVKKLNDLMDAA